ncbi:hypothetical protein RB213_006299 [Colletotrichum asianum]
MTVDCESPPDSTDMSDPDVSGIGVSIGFVGTGCLMILLLIIYYVFVFDPKLDPLRKQGQAMKNQDRPNEIDVAVLRRVKMDASDRIKLTDYRAICLFNESKLSNGSVPEIAMLADTTFSVSMLVFGLIIRTVKMSRGVFRWTSFYRSCVRSKLAVIVKGENFGLRRVLGHHAYTLFIARSLAVSWILGRLYAELCSSFLAEVAWVMITASWGLKQLLLIRAEGPEDENSWSFGQVAAVVLFISPLCLAFEQFFNPGTADARRNGAARTRSDDLLEIQPQEPESVDARRESIEWIRLVDITACWDAPSSRATVHLFVGFNFLLMVYAFNDYVVFRAFVKMMTWFFVYQPIQAALVLLLGMELEQTELWVQSHALRRATVVALIIACLLGTIGIFLPSWEAPFTHLYVCPWEIVPVCLDYLMVGVVVLQFGVYLLIYMARNSSRALRSGG